MQHLTRSQRQVALAIGQGAVDARRVYVPPPARRSKWRVLRRIIADGIMFVTGAIGVVALLALMVGGR